MRPSWLTLGILEASWGYLEAPWGHLGLILAVSWAILGPSWGILGASWSMLKIMKQNLNIGNYQMLKMFKTTNGFLMVFEAPKRRRLS